MVVLTGVHARRRQEQHWAHRWHSRRSSSSGACCCSSISRRLLGRLPLNGMQCRHGICNGTRTVMLRPHVAAACSLGCTLVTLLAAATLVAGICTAFRTAVITLITLTTATLCCALSQAGGSDTSEQRCSCASRCCHVIATVHCTCIAICGGCHRDTPSCAFQGRCSTACILAWRQGLDHQVVSAASLPHGELKVTGA